MIDQLKNTDKFLIIVESPNKVKTITNILKNAGYTNVTVLASVGHIMFLDDGGPAYNSGIYPKKDFQMNLTVIKDRNKVINDINTKAQQADKIFIMTDGDREGELIAWSLLKFCRLPAEKCFRVITHEITPRAIITALQNPTQFDNNLVEAGLSRMMSDKLIGYGLSPLGKKYIGAKSIGRCQSIGLKLISDREKEIADFIPELYFNLYLDFYKNTKSYKAKYYGYKTEIIDKLTKQADVDAIINDCKNTPFIIENIKKINHKESPKAAFCTATFQQEAANKLGLRVKDAMSCAQKLFEGINLNGHHKGLITYIRTDSTEIAPEFIPELEAFIKNIYGSKNFVGPQKKKKKATDQDGHEAIRVVDLTITPEILAQHISNNLLIKVYKLIWQRTIASVMSQATITETCYTITNNSHLFTFSTKTLIDAGYKVVYNDNKTEAIENELSFNIGDKLEKAKLESTKNFTQPKARYTEASLIKELQQREIGRPSTYATIIETLLNPNRGYAKLSEKSIMPTDRGMQLADYCNRSFPTLINLNYTKELESNLDLIAKGKLSYLEYMKNFYKNLQEIIENTNETGLAPEMPEQLCPICGKPMIVRRSRFGKLFYGCSTYPKCKGILGID